MLAFSYNILRGIVRTVPICPKPKAVGLENIPKEGPIIYVYNHITRRGEPVYLGMAAPPKPNIRFFAETTIASREYLPRLRKDVEDSIFAQRYRKKVKKIRLAKLCYFKLIDYLARYVIAQTKKINVIVVDLYEPTTEEEKLKKRRINKKALLECIKSLENNIPLAIAPSGGKTHKSVERPVYHTIVPTLVSTLYKRGKSVKIVPSVVKERPMINQKTYWHYAADRIFVYKAIRWLMNLFKIKSYQKPCLTVEFLPPLTFENANSSKHEKVEFVKNLQQLFYDTLKEE
jgi:hypothetical protein